MTQVNTSQNTAVVPLRGGDWLLLAIVGLFPLATGYFNLLPALIWEHHPFHAVVEGFGAFAAIIVACALMLLRRQGDLTAAHSWLIYGLIGMGMLDGFHAATHAGHLFVWLHSLATCVGGILFACVWLPERLHRDMNFVATAGLTFVAVTFVGIVSVAAPDTLPIMKDAAGFTLTAKALNIVGGLGFLAAATFFVFRRGRTKDSLLFANLSLLFGVAGIIFEQSVLWDANWWLWHLLRMLGYGAVLYVFFATYYQLLMELHQVHGTVEIRMEELAGREADLRSAHRRLDSILNSTADAIIAINEVGIVQSFNDSADRLFDYRRDEVIGQNVSMLMPAPYSHEHDEYLRRYLRTGETHVLNQERELEAVRKDGSRFAISLRVTEMQDGETRMFNGVVQDITARKQADAERQRLFDIIRETVNHLSTSSEQISATMAEQARGSEGQAAGVAQTVAAVEEVTRAARQSAEVANHVSETARRADDIGKSGRKAIEETRVSMNAVREQVELTAGSILTLVDRAQAIGEIIIAVTEIAEQTNVLALNAAIEASRAGDAGQGFAVVAAEVKALAEQAKTATAQVRTILGEIQSATNDAVNSTERGTESVETANRVVADAEQTISSLGNIVGEAARAAAKIVAASNQQATSMSQMTQSMSEIEKTARQSLSSTRQTAEAAQELNQLGHRLKQLTEAKVGNP